SEQGGAFFHEGHAGRGTAVGDLDDDGSPDIVTVNLNDPVRILRNRKAPENYVSVQLRARKGDPDAIGARVTTRFAGRSLVRFVVRGAGFFSHFDPRIIFPTDPSATHVDAHVEWPAGGRESFRDLAVRQSHLLIEGRGETFDE
ncbi:MAG TPA: ASPIC/UnbV domain-containing protein, partial [Planctomycetaceae bacterium]|nr:ASPIC/UnbV domain-containing protein [Planctomycetaceae bacterium]